MWLVVGRGLVVVMDVAATAGISTALLSPLVQTEPSQEEGGLEEEGGLKSIHIIELNSVLVWHMHYHNPNRGIDTE